MSIPHEYRKKIEGFALGCPVKESMHPDMQIPVLFHYDIA
jgi:hypothetical protein